MSDLIEIEPLNSCSFAAERWAATPLIENPVDGSVLLLVPGGKFLAGAKKFPVELPSYYLGLHSITNGQYAKFLEAVQPSRLDQEKWILLDENCFVRLFVSGYKSVSGKDEHPVVQVSWYGAKAYCSWAGLRLPSELEWEKGARGVDGREYPWGNYWDASYCRNDGNRGRETTCSVWSYLQDRSVWGHYQMSGNVLEWCADWYEGNAYARYRQGDIRPPMAGDRRVQRGGSWYCNDSDLFRCRYRFHVAPEYRRINYGFRVARTHTP